MLKSGDTFGDYRVVSLLGQGGMGSVYLLGIARTVLALTGATAVVFLGFVGKSCPEPEPTVAAKPRL